MPLLGRWLGVMVLVWPVAGCDRKPPPDRAAQCASLMRMIAEQEAKGKTESDEPNALMKSAAVVEAAGAATMGIELFDEELIAVRRRYTNMARDLGSSSRDAARAFAGKDESEKVRARDRLDTSRAVERKVRKALAEACPAAAK